MKICWFTTGRDFEAVTLFTDVIGAIDAGAIEGTVAALFLNRERHESEASDIIIARAEERSIPVEALSTKRFLSQRGLSLGAGRSLFDAEVYERIKRFDFDIIFLAGYMLILSPVLFDAFPVLNLHPSLPGAYKGTWEDVINRTIDDGKREFGAMIHMVEAGLDEGAPITFARAELSGPVADALYRRTAEGDKTARAALFRMMREKEFGIETPLIIQTLSLLSKGIIEIRGISAFFNGKPAHGGVDITAEVQKWPATRI